MKHIILIAGLSLCLHGCGDENNQRATQQDTVQKAAHGDKKAMRDLEKQVRAKARADKKAQKEAARKKTSKPSDDLAQYTKALMSGPPGSIEKLKALAAGGNPNAQLWKIRSTVRVTDASAEAQAQARTELEAIATLAPAYQYQALSGQYWPLAAEAAFLISDDYLSAGALYPADTSQALKWLNTASAGGQPEAMFKLGIRYQYGLDVDADIENAKSWLKKSADAGWRQAASELEKLGK